MLLLAFLLAGLLPAMLVSFLSFYQAKTALKKEIIHDLQTLSQTVANNVSRMMFERTQNVASWSRLAIMQELQIDDIDKRLSTFLRELQLSYGDVYRTIYVVNLQNKVIASSNTRQLNQTIAAPESWFSIGVGDKKIAFSIIQNDVLALSQDVIEPSSNQVIGRLIAEFNWQQIQYLLSSAVQKPSTVALLGEHGKALAASKNWDADVGYEMYATTEFSIQPAAPIWKVRVEKLHSLAVQPVHRLGYIFLALLASTLLFAAFLVTPIAQAITQPLAKLTLFVRSFKQEQLAETPKTGPPEVQELAIAFENMMQDLAKTQDNLTRAAKLAVVGEMAAAMSHEVRTPLGILRSSADLLLREPKLTKDGEEVLGFIISETERLNRLVSTLIDSARPRQPQFVAVDLADLIKKVIGMLRGQSEPKNITLNLALSKPLIAEIDHDQITQVIMNIVLNAIQILPMGGQIFIRLYQQQDTVMIEVADDGPGITDVNQAHIFEPFFTQRAGGVGLGLAVVRQIVQAHSGDIRYTNSQFGGAQFTISLPTHRVTT
ncbi:MAG: two-component sensor histidine kinase [Methylotenera sp.]|nr:MAG: two-component sensor histidine kinase [Methylotenera sp.]